MLEMRAMNQAAADRIMAFQANKDVTSPFEDLDLDEPLSARMQSPVTPPEYIEWLLDSVLPDCINMRSPRCLAHMANYLPDFIATLGSILAPLNQNMAKRQASRAFSRLEEDAIVALHKLVFGFSEEFYVRRREDAGVFGLVVSGGTMANITAMWVARNQCLGPLPGFAGIEEEGADAALRAHGYRGAAVIGSDLTHYSFDKAMGLAGFGTRSLAKLPSGPRGRIRLADVEARISEIESAKAKVLALVGIAGTTDCGSIDPLAELGQLARRRGLHFHVDAAWGAPLLFSRRHQGLLRGIELADTVTVDGHKQLHLPIGTAVLLFREPTAATAIRKQASYMLQEGMQDLGSYSPEGSRPAASIYLHAALSVIGQSGYERMVDATIETAGYMARTIRRRPEFQLLMEPETNLVLYRYIPPGLRDRARQGSLTLGENRIIDRVNEQLQSEQYRAGFALVSRTTLRESLEGSMPVVALRAVISNPQTTSADIDAVLDDQIQAARRGRQEL
jgi:glutamate decarboxylase